MNKFSQFVGALGLIALLALPVRGQFTDDFDSYPSQAAFDAAWTAQGAAMTLTTTNRSVSGSNSIYQGTGAQQSWKLLPSPIPASKLDFSFSFYDPVGPGNLARTYGMVYSRVNDSWSSALNQIVAIGKWNQIADSGNPTYHARVAFASSNWFKLDDPGAPVRTVGWHTARVIGQPSGNNISYTFYIDGIACKTMTSTVTNDFNFVVMGSALSSTHGMWFDNVSVEATVPYTFQRVKSFGYTNLAGAGIVDLIEGSDGKLYGTTAQGGGHFQGMIFGVDKGGSNYHVLHSFPADDSSTVVSRKLIEGTDGALYGLAYRSQLSATNLGIVYKMNKDGAGYTVLRQFPSGAEALPMDLLEGTDGLLYGVTAGDNISGYGTVFKLNKDGTGFTSMHTFGSTNGGALSLIEGDDGMLYGVTGANAFKLNKDGSGFSVYPGVIGGENLIEGSDGMLYWKQSYSTIVRMNKNGSGLAVVVNSPVGVQPTFFEGSDGKLYGRTWTGGFSGGMAFKVNKDGSGYVEIFDQDYASFDSLLEVDGKLYGSGGAGILYGGGFVGGGLTRLNKDGTGFVLVRLFSTTGGDGATPSAGRTLIEGSDGLLYGTTSGGGNLDKGTVFRMNRDGSGQSVLHYFTTSSLEGPRDLIEGSDGVLYGVTSSPFLSSPGHIFKLHKDGSGYALLKSLNEDKSEGNAPTSLIEGSDGALYGTTSGGGAANAGVLFRINKDGSGFTLIKQFLFASSHGLAPQCLLEGSDGTLYGTTKRGGTGSYGTVFKLNKDGTGFVLLCQFNPTIYWPNSGLIEGSDGLLYGTTEVDTGLSYDGVVFALKKDGTGFSVIYRSPSGSSLGSGVTEGVDGSLFGTFSGNNAVSKINKVGGGFSILRDLSSHDGTYPVGELFVGSDGALYGTTRSGGDMDFGTIFKLSRGDATNSPTTPLQITPTAVSVTNGASITFTASGGTPPYTFSADTFDSMADITSSGLYTAGPLCGADTVLVTDSLGSNATATVTVNDTLPPIINCPGNIVMNTNAATVPVSFNVSADDNCTFSPTVLCAPASGSLFAQGSTLVTCTATDNAGRSNLCTFAVTVTNAAPPPPVIFIAPSSITVSTGALVTFTATGGTPPYNFFIGVNQSGASITTVAEAGDYVAGHLAGTDSVYVMDVLGSNALATVTVTNSPPTNCVPVSSGLVAWWRGENSAQDSMGVHHGETVNSAAYASGFTGDAFTFDGNDDEVNVPSSPPLSAWMGGAMTIGAWVFLPEVPAFDPITAAGARTIVGKTGPAGYEYALMVGTNSIPGFVTWQQFGAGHATVYSGTLSTGMWHHVVGVLSEGQYIRLYLNGALAAEDTAFAGSMTAGGLPFRIGHRGDGQHFHGRVDEVKLYNRALSSSEILAAYQGCVAPPLQLSPANTNVTSGVSVVFAASGGAPPYTFSLATNVSGGSLTINALYTAGATAGADTILVTDALGRNATANVTVLPINPLLRIIAAGPETLTVSWESQASGFALEWTESLAPPVNWRETPITNGITNDGILKAYNITNFSEVPARFYRLRVLS